MSRQKKECKEKLQKFVSSSGMRLIVLFSMLLESPKTAEEIIEKFLNYNCITGFSIDTLRHDLNDLRKAGCKISRTNRFSKKYILKTHPFLLDFDEQSILTISSLYKNIYLFLNISDLILIDEMFYKLSKYLIDDEQAEILRGISILYKTNLNILKELNYLCGIHYKCKFEYERSRVGVTQIELIPEEIFVKNEKIYVKGYCLNFAMISYFNVQYITKISTVFIGDNKYKVNTNKAKYLLKTKKYKPASYERILEERKEGLVIESDVYNEFDFIQKMLGFGDSAIVLEPLEIREKLITKLKSMKKVYENGDV